MFNSCYSEIVQNDPINFVFLFAAIKNLGEKAEGILEEQKKKVEELAVEKKNAAAALLEQQVSLIYLF